MLVIGWTCWKRAVFTFVFSLLSAYSASAFSQEISIFDVRHTLALSDEEPLFKDYYLNAGSERGLKAGMIITVVRSLALYDSYQNKAAGELAVEVGQVKIIHAQKNLAVARDYSAISRISHPLLDYDFVMVGDSLDLETMTTEAKAKAKTAALELPEGASPAAAPDDAVVIQKTAEPQARQEGAAFAIDFASKAPVNEPAPTAVSTLQ